MADMLDSLFTPPDTKDFDEEMKFRGWYVPMAMKLGISPNPDDPEHHYDNRAFYRDMVAGVPGVVSPDKPGGHFPSTYKTEGHPRTYLTDPGRGQVFDTRSGNYLTGEAVSPQALRASEQSPDMPGFDPERARGMLSALYGRYR